MSDLQQLAERYIEVWNETDATRRRRLITELFTDGATYTDPLGAVSGHGGIDEFIARAQGQFTGLTFRLGSDVDAHHDIARFSWHLCAADAAEPAAIGFDVVVAEAGRVRQVLGFLDKVPG